MTTLHFDPMTGKYTRITVLDGDTTHPQQCHPTPYALFQHVPLSECKHIVRLHQRMIQQPDYAARVHISAAYWQRALAAVTAERDALRRELDAMTGEL